MDRRYGAFCSAVHHPLVFVLFARRGNTGQSRSGAGRRARQDRADRGHGEPGGQFPRYTGRRRGADSHQRTRTHSRNVHLTGLGQSHARNAVGTASNGGAQRFQSRWRGAESPDSAGSRRAGGAPCRGGHRLAEDTASGRGTDAGEYVRCSVRIIFRASRYLVLRRDGQRVGQCPHARSGPRLDCRTRTLETRDAALFLVRPLARKVRRIHLVRR